MKPNFIPFGQIRNTLRGVVNNQSHAINSMKKEKALQRKQQFIEKRNGTQVQNASAISLLNELLPERNFPNDLKIDPFTEFSKEELDIISKTKNFRLMYKVLGTSANQLKDSLLIDQDVQQFLERDEIHKAVLLVHLGRTKGLFAWGTILQYLLKNGKVNEALKIFNDTKKRGLVADSRIMNILLSSVKKGEQLSNEKVEWYYKLMATTPKSQLNIINFNSALKLFRTNRRSDLAIKLLTERIENVDVIGAKKSKPIFQFDVKTYTEIFANLRHYTDYEKAIELAELYFLQLQRDRDLIIDDLVIRNYSSLFIFSNDICLLARAMLIIKQYYRVCPMDQINNDNLNLNDYLEWLVGNGSRKLSEGADVSKILLREDQVNIKKTKRFAPDEAIIKRYDHLCRVFKVENTYDPEKKHMDDHDSKKNYKSSSKPDYKTDRRIKSRSRI